MTAPLSTLRNGVQGKVRERDDVSYEEARGNREVRILHLAERERGYRFALCGKPRNLPLDPQANGQLCVVCAELYFRKHGYSWGSRP